MRSTALLTALFALVFSASSTAFAADPQLLNLVMPDAKLIAGLNVTSARISPLGQFLLTKMPTENLPAGMTVDSVTEIVAASAATPGGHSGLLLAKGTFDAEKIVAAIEATKNPPAHQVKTYAGAELITFTAPDGKTAAAVAFIGSTVVVAGDAPTVMAALDRSSANNAIDPALAAQVNSLSGTQDAWIVSAVSPASLMPAPKAPAAGQSASPIDIGQFLATIQAFSGGVKFGATVPVKLDVVSNSDKNAEALANVVKFAVSMRSMNAGQAKQDPNTAAAMKLLQTLQVTNTGANVDIALTVPEAQIEALIGSLSKPKAN